MRIYLNLIATLLVALLAMSGIVSAAGTTSVETTVVSAQEVTPPTNAAIIQAAQVGTESLSEVANVVVNSNVDWDLMVQGTNEGKMISGTVTTQAPMQVSATSTPQYNQLTGVPTAILSSQNYGASINTPVIYSQVFGYADKAGTYNCTVTWTIGPVA